MQWPVSVKWYNIQRNVIHTKNVPLGETNLRKVTDFCLLQDQAEYRWNSIACPEEGGDWQDNIRKNYRIFVHF
jgi:hypothetical protein